MKVIIDEAFAERSPGGMGPSMAQVGPHVREGRYDLVKSPTNELILPGLWNQSIKPGDRVVMSMREYPIMTALLLFPQTLSPPPHSRYEDHDFITSSHLYSVISASDAQQYLLGPPPNHALVGWPSRPFIAEPRREAQQYELRERVQRVMGFRRQYMEGAVPLRESADDPLPAWKSAISVRPSIPPMPNLGGGIRVSPPRASIIDHSISSSASSSSSDEDVDITPEEQAQLSFVDYVEEFEKVKNVTLSDLLSKFTYLKDVSNDFLDMDDFDGYDSDDSSTSGGSSTVSL